MNKSKKTWLMAFIALFIGAVSAIFYPFGFILWNVPLYVFCWIGMTVSAFLLAWAYFIPKGGKALFWSALCGAGFFALTFGISTLVHYCSANYDLRYTIGVVEGCSFIYYLTFFILICKNTRTVWRTVVGSILLVVVFFSDLVGMIPPNIIINWNEYILAIEEARDREYTVLPDEAFVRAEPDYEKEVRLYVNLDETTPVPDLIEYLEGKDIMPEDLGYYLEPYIDTGVTDILFCVLSQNSSSPTDVLTYRGDKVKQTTENGKSVDYSEIPYWWFSLQEAGINPYLYWFEECRQKGINPWLSIRMNDCHDSGEETSFLRGDLFYEAQKNGWMIGEEYGYYHTCFNYSVPQIREIMLEFIREQLLRYDVYGLELDWMREIYCFDYLHADNAEIVSIMNGFMREVNSIIVEAEQKWGHDLKLTARLMRDLDQCKIYGFDVRAWAEEGLIDSVTVTPRFTSCDSGMDIKKWKEELPTIEINAGIETLVSPDGKSHKGSVASEEVVRGYAAEYLAEGADGLYLFNYMGYPSMSRNEGIYQTCGDMRAVYSLPRRHVMTYQDTVPVGEKGYRPLPVAVLKNGTATLIQKTGFISEDAVVNVYIGFATKIKFERLMVTTNNSECIFMGPGTVYADNENREDPIANGYVPEGSYLYRFTVRDVSQLGNVLFITVKNNGVFPLVITYLEIEVIPSGS